MIAGGLDRGNEFDELIPDITGLKKMVILGESAPRVKRAADKAGVTYLDAKDVADATRIAFDQASAGDVVLLSLQTQVGICTRISKCVVTNLSQLLSN